MIRLIGLLWLTSGAALAFQAPFKLAFEANQPAPFAPPALSPDGQWLVYGIRKPPTGLDLSQPFLPSGTPGTAAGASLWLTDVSTGVTRRIGPEPGNNYKPNWSPDSRMLAFVSDAAGQPHAWVYHLDGDQSRKLSDTPLKPLIWSWDLPWWSPDGNWVYVQTRPPANDMAPKPTHAGVGESDETRLAQVFTSGSEAAPAPNRPRAPGNADFHRRVMGLTNTTLARIALQNGKAETLVPHDQQPYPAAMRISPSGRFLSYLSVLSFPENGPPGVSLTVCDADGSDCQVVASGLPRPPLHFFGQTYRWHPREDRLYFVQTGQLKVAAANTSGSFQTPAPFKDAPTDLATWPLLFDRTGNGLFLGKDSTDAGDYRGPQPGALAYFDLDKAETTTLSWFEGLRYDQLIAANWRTAWQPEPETATIQTQDKETGETVFVRLHLDGKVREINRQQARFNPAWTTPDHKQLVTMFNNVNHPPDWQLINAEVETIRSLSEIEPALSRLPDWKVCFLTTDISGWDGQAKKIRFAVLSPVPAPASPPPAIVFHYGGADLSASANRFAGGEPASFPNWIFAGRGYAIVLTNVPLGPEGQPGEPLKNYNTAIWPQIHTAANAGLIDPDRIVAIGQSYGGYGTAALISQSHGFKAGIAISGVFDLAASFAESDTHFWYEQGQARMGNHPWAETNRYIENSPFYHADKVDTPLLLIHGDRDPAITDARRYFQALARLGKDAQLAVYPGQGHGLGTWQPDLASDACERMLSFIARHIAD